MSDKTVSKKKGLFRCLVRFVTGFVLVTLVIVVAGGVWLVPGVIRREVERGLSQFCEGPVDIERVTMSWSGQVTIEAIQFCDTTNRQWLLVEKVKAVLANWPSFSPTVEEITIDGLDLRLSVADGKLLAPPLRLPQRLDQPDDGPGIRKVAISRAAVTVVDTHRDETVYGGLALSVVLAANGDYDFSLTRITADSSQVFLAKGVVNPETSDFDISLQMKHRFTKAEMALALAGLDVPAISAEGDLAGDLSVAGCLTKPSEWHPKGTLRLRDWLVEADGATGWKGLNTDVQVGPDGLGFENLSISDSNGVEWLSAARVELALTNWPGSNPSVTTIELDAPRLRMTAADSGKFRVPAWLPEHEASDSTISTSSLQRLVVRDAAIAVEDPNGPKVIIDRLWLDAGKQDDSYNVALSRRAADDSNAVSVKGAVNPATSQVRLSLQMDHVATEQETALAFAALGIPQYSVKGKLVADLAIAGDLNEPLGLEATGSVKCDGCTVFFKEAILAEGLAVSAKLGGRRLDIESYQAAVCRGTVSGYLRADVNDANAVEFRGRVLAVNVNVPEFHSLLTAAAQKASSGTFTASFDFAGRRDGSSTFNGRGLLFFDDADVSVLPAIPQIFASTGLSQYEPLRMSDAEAIFTTAGPVVTIESGHISNPFAAIEFEPGGTIDLHAGQIDGYVVAAPLSQIAGAVEDLPLINILARWKDKLMRLRVKGNWSDPQGRLITKEPVKDLKESTVGFIQDVVRSGGQFGRGVLDGLGGLFKTNQNKTK